MRRVGWLVPWGEKDPVTQASAKVFARALEQSGWVEGKNIRIDYRFAAGDPALYKTYAAELAALSPDVILAGNTPAVEALRQQTRTIPIVFRTRVVSRRVGLCSGPRATGRQRHWVQRL